MPPGYEGLYFLQSSIKRINCNNCYLLKYVYEKEYFPTSVYGGINIPVMIVLGDRDMISIEHGLEMHRLIKNSQYCVLPNTTHEVFAEKPDLINKIAIDFLK
jgi:pimeloyl-ACP methyl ester carboxylesterase